VSDGGITSGTVAYLQRELQKATEDPSPEGTARKFALAGELQKSTDGRPIPSPTSSSTGEKSVAASEATASSSSAATTVRPKSSQLHAVEITVAKGGKTVTMTAAEAADLAVGERYIGAEGREELAQLIAEATKGGKMVFPKRADFEEFIEKLMHLESEGADDDEAEDGDEADDGGDDAGSDEEEVKQRWNAGTGKEDRTVDRSKGSGNKTDRGTRLFKEDKDFRNWVHELKQKGQLVRYGVDNRTGGADNLTNKELRILERAYLAEKR